MEQRERMIKFERKMLSFIRFKGGMGVRTINYTT